MNPYKGEIDNLKNWKTRENKAKNGEKQKESQYPRH